MAEQRKVFKDPIHGAIELHPLLVKIIDTPQFQRLRNIKQLGALSYVYPGATHSRFEHSIGVAYLAGELLKSIREKQQDLGITDWDVLCVQIAALCHDLGHGPFSHMFDLMFLPEARRLKATKQTHEDLSKKMFDHLMKNNNGLLKYMKDVRKEMTEDKGDAEGIEELKNILKEDLDFIKDLIDPEIKPEKTQAFGQAADKAGGASKQRPPSNRSEKRYILYDVVSNTINKIDVDKWDYFARDCHYLGMKNSFDHERLIKSARACEVDGEWQICYRDKDVFNLYDMFYTRFSLHKRAYQHKVKNSIELMITDAFLAADKHLSLSEAIDDVEKYTQLTDDVFEKIRNDSSGKLDDAKAILQRIHRRDLYSCLGELISQKSKKELQEIKNIWEQLEINNPEGGTENLKPEDFVVDVKEINYGMKEKDPIKHVWFYKKDDPTKPFKLDKDQVSNLLPGTFSEKIIRIYCKKTTKETLKAAKIHFEKYKKIHDDDQ